MRFGLHEYLMDFLEHISGLGDEVSRAFLVPVLNIVSIRYYCNNNHL